MPSDIQPPPPPPPVENVPTDSDSSDDDGGQPWHPIAEDTSTPDEEELKEIEAGTEYSALDHEHWEKKAFTPLDDPEYTPGESGRIEWVIENYNGTREKPNRDMVMRSNTVIVGGHEWRIKFYPKGNDSDYLSVYVECLSVEEKKAKGKEPEENSTKLESQAQPDTEKESEENSTKVESEAQPDAEVEVELQHTPLPLLNAKTVPKRKSVAAQVSVVLYNPAEPRVNYSRTCLHRFCTSSPDWGWTRFHGPHYDIAHRTRGHRQALLRGDKLAFTGYIRIIEDQTNCLWEHPSSDNVWDSFAMTGLQSTALRDNEGSPDGNIVTAITSWLMFKPFRQFLYEFKIPDAAKEPFARPKPLIAALQKVLYQLRTRVQPGAGSVDLGDIDHALDWYGSPEPLHKFDVIQIWEYIRTQIEYELRDTPFVHTLDDLYGPKRDYTKGVPSYRVPVVGVGSMQEAVNQSPNLLEHGSFPQLLNIELERQVFDPASRSYVKVLNKVSLDDHINVKGTRYTLYGFVVHKQNLQSCIYQPVLRPEGPGSKWYNYTDSREGNKVVCLTHREAIGAHEGKESAERVTGNDSIAYIVMYMRDDVAQSVLTPQAGIEQWDVPDWIPRELEKQNTSERPPPIPIPTEDPEAPQTKEDDKNDDNMEEVEEREFLIFDSKVFLQHEGPGLFDAFDTKWRSDNSALTNSITLSARDGCAEIRDKIQAAFKNNSEIKDPRQIKFWFLETMVRSFAHPHLLSTGKMEYSSGGYNRFSEDMKDWKLENSPADWETRRLWVHIIPFADLPEPPKQVEPEPAPEVPPEATSQQPQQSQQTESVPVPEAPTNEDSTVAVQPTQPVTSGDTPMSEPDEAEPVPEPQQTPSSPAEIESSIPHANIPEAEDTDMVEVDASNPPDPPVVDVFVSNNTGDDTEMGGTQEPASIPPPPADLPVPPPEDIQERPQTPPPVEAPRPRTPEPPPDEIYFFLKYFNAEKQILEPKGSFIVLKSARLETTVQKLLELPETKYEWWEEEDLVQARALRRSRSFSSNDLHNAATIIYTQPLTDDQKNSLADRAAFADIHQYLQFRASARNFPARMNGHFTFSYFSSQSYKGVYVNGHRHGHGSRIYHSGATYEGSFRLGHRHGHGLYTFQNGDTYDGDWVSNQQHGTGTFVEATTGNTYTGGWRHDKKFGEGVTHWKSAQEMERLCRICWEEPAEAAFYDCGHVVACVGCARQVESCPVCRRRVLSAMKLYYVA